MDALQKARAMIVRAKPWSPRSSEGSDVFTVELLTGPASCGFPVNKPVKLSVTSEGLTLRRRRTMGGHQIHVEFSRLARWESSEGGTHLEIEIPMMQHLMGGTYTFRTKASEADQICTLAAELKAKEASTNATPKVHRLSTFRRLGQALRRTRTAPTAAQPSPPETPALPRAASMPVRRRRTSALRASLSIRSRRATALWELQVQRISDAMSRSVRWTSRQNSSVRQSQDASVSRDAPVSQDAPVSLERQQSDATDVPPPSSEAERETGANSGGAGAAESKGPGASEHQGAAVPNAGDTTPPLPPSNGNNGKNSGAIVAPESTYHTPRPSFVPNVGDELQGLEEESEAVPVEVGGTGARSDTTTGTEEEEGGHPGLEELDASLARLQLQQAATPPLMRLATMPSRPGSAASSPKLRRVKTLPTRPQSASSSPKRLRPMAAKEGGPSSLSPLGDLAMVLPACFLAEREIQVALTPPRGTPDAVSPKRQGPRENTIATIGEGVEGAAFPVEQATREGNMAIAGTNEAKPSPRPRPHLTLNMKPSSGRSSPISPRGSPHQSRIMDSKQWSPHRSL